MAEQNAPPAPAAVKRPNLGGAVPGCQGGPKALDRSDCSDLADVDGRKRMSRDFHGSAEYSGRTVRTNPTFSRSRVLVPHCSGSKRLRIASAPPWAIMTAARSGA